MDSSSGGAQAPGVYLRPKSRAITNYNASSIVLRGATEAMVDPDFDEDTYTRSPAGDTLYYTCGVA